VIVGLVLKCMALGAFKLWSADAMRVEAPSDQDVISVFQVHRSEFDRLRQMVTEDMHAQSYFSEATIDRIAPLSRKLEYQKLLRIKSGLAVGVDYDGERLSEGVYLRACAKLVYLFSERRLSQPAADVRCGLGGLACRQADIRIDPWPPPR